MNGIAKLLRNEPALSAGAAQTVIALIAGLGLHLTAREAGSMLAATSVILAALVALSARPVRVPALAGAAAALWTVLAGFAPHAGGVPQGSAAIAVLGALVLRGHLTPLETRRIALALPAEMPPVA